MYVCLFNPSNPVVISITISAVCLVLYVLLDPVMSLCVLCNTWRPQPKCKCAYARYSIEHRSLWYWSSLLDKNANYWIFSCVSTFSLFVHWANILLSLYHVSSCSSNIVMLFSPTPAPLLNVQHTAISYVDSPHCVSPACVVCNHFVSIETFFTDPAHQIMWLIWILKKSL